MAVAVMSAAPSLFWARFFGAVCPAVRFRKPQRQKATLAVMTSLLGTARRRNTTRRRGAAS